MSGGPVVLGLDFGGTKFAIAVAEPTGERIAELEIDSGAAAGARTGFDRGLAAARELLEVAAPGRPLAAVGAATFGIPFDDRVELAPAIEGWEELAFGSELRVAFPEAVVLTTTDVKAAAAAEARWGVLKDCDPALYLNLGTGLAVAVVANGRVVSGAHGASGEIGYNLRAVADVGRADRTILEETVSGIALGRLASAAFGTPTTAEQLFAAARASTGAATARELLGDFVKELAFHLVNVAVLLDPVRIAVGGGMARDLDLLRPVIEPALQAGVPYPPELVLARFPYDAPLVGALALACEATSSGPARELLGEQAPV